MKVSKKLGVGPKIEQALDMPFRYLDRPTDLLVLQHGHGQTHQFSQVSNPSNVV